MATLWRDMVVVDKPVFDGERQRDALSGFQKAADLDATAAAQAVGLSYPQYNRYLWGRVPLRTDQLALFARAYGVTVAALTRALGLMDDEPDAALLEQARKALGPSVDDATARTVERELRAFSQADRDAVLTDMAANPHEHRQS